MIVWNTKFYHPAKCELKRIKVPDKDWNAMVSKTLEPFVVSDLEKFNTSYPEPSPNLTHYLTNKFLTHKTHKSSFLVFS